MGDGGLHLAAQGVVLQLDPAQPLLHSPAQLPRLSVRLIQHVLRPAVGLQLHPGGPLLDGRVGCRPGLQLRHTAAQAVPLPAQLLQLPALGLLPLPAGLQHRLHLLQLLAQALPVPVEDGHTLLLVRLLRGQLPPVLLRLLQAPLKLLLLLSVLRRRLFQIVQHILPVEAAEGGAAKGMVHGAPRLRPFRGNLSYSVLFYHIPGGITIPACAFVRI